MPHLFERQTDLFYARNLHVFLINFPPFPDLPFTAKVLQGGSYQTEEADECPSLNQFRMYAPT